MRIVLLGPPAAGKGTQARRLAARFGVPHLSTGEMLRVAASSGSPTGLRIKALIDAGNLVPDADVLAMVAERINEHDASGGYVLDGFPRTVGQSEALDLLLAAGDHALDAVVELRVDVESLLGRVSVRAAAAMAAGEDVRADDNPESLRQRIETYLAKTKPVSDHYRRAGRLLQVDGMLEPDGVEHAIAIALGQVASMVG